MKPVYLKFPDEETAAKALAGIPGSVSVDVIGTIYSDPVFSGEKLVTQPKAQPGYHVNLLVEETPEELAPYVIEPASPRRVFAGFSPEDMARQGGIDA